MGKSKKSKKDKKDKGGRAHVPNQAQPLVPGQLMVANDQMQLVPYTPPAQPHVQYLGCKPAAGST